MNLNSYLEIINFFFFFPEAHTQVTVGNINTACIWDVSYGKKWSTEQWGWKQWGISALVWRRRFVEEKTVITALYSHSDRGRGQPLLVSMVCMSRERSWCTKCWEPLSESFSNLKGMIEIRKWFKNCPHIYIYSCFGESNSDFGEGCSLVGGLEELNSVFPWFISKVAPGCKPRILCRRGEKRAEGREGIKTNRGLRFSEETEGCGEEMRDFSIHSINIAQTWCCSRTETNTKHACALGNFELIIGNSDGFLNLNH